LNNANMQNCIWKSFMYFYIFVPPSSSWKKKNPTEWSGAKMSRSRWRVFFSLLEVLA
jgi:hypothetical protein